MISKQVLLVSLLLPCLTLSLSCQTKAAALSLEKDFAISIDGGDRSLVLGSSIETFEAILGKPTMATASEGEQEYDKYSWEGIVAFCLVGNIVSSIRIESAAFSTARNVKLGDTLEYVIKQYGKPKMLGKNKYYYSVFKEDVWQLSFIVSADQTIAEIRLSVGN